VVGHALLLLAGLGCGARAMLEPDPGSEPLAGAGAGGLTTPEASGGRGGTGAPPLVPDQPDEPDQVPCAEPVPQARIPRRDCHFVDRGSCYATEQCACAGACLPGEQCIIGGFLSPDDPQTVTCIDLR
jgi:hypothetical protein